MTFLTTNKTGTLKNILITVLAAVIWLFLAGCDLAKDTADTAKQEGDGAVGVAEKMSKGTLGDELDDE